MEQKLTNEEIAKVFAMYLGAEVVYTRGNYSDRFYYTLVDMFNNSICSANSERSSFQNCQLLLTILSGITDEHAIEVGKIWNISTVTNHDISDIKEYFIEYGIPQNIELYQYLISKGYAVPLWFGIDHWANGKTAIELNIAVEKAQ